MESRNECDVAIREQQIQFCVLLTVVVSLSVAMIMKLIHAMRNDRKGCKNRKIEYVKFIAAVREEEKEKRRTETVKLRGEKDAELWNLKAEISIKSEKHSEEMKDMMVCLKEVKSRNAKIRWRLIKREVTYLAERRRAEERVERAEKVEKVETEELGVQVAKESSDQSTQEKVETIELGVQVEKESNAEAAVTHDQSTQEKVETEEAGVQVDRRLKDEEKKYHVKFASPTNHQQQKSKIDKIHRTTAITKVPNKVHLEEMVFSDDLDENFGFTDEQMEKFMRVHGGSKMPKSKGRRSRLSRWVRLQWLLFKGRHSM